MKEAVVQKWVREQLEKEYGDLMVYIKYPAGQYSTRGVSDLIFCIVGQYVAIEVKTETGKLTKLQKRFGDNVIKAGGIFYTIYGKDDEVIELVKRQIKSRTTHIR